MKKITDFYEQSSVEQAQALARHALEILSRDISSPAAAEEVWSRVESEAIFRELIRNWENWGALERRKAWAELSRVLEKAAYATRPYCLRCGTCCRKGSPSLYREDLSLLRRGTVSRLDLITLRKGERVFSNETDAFFILPEEQVKVREKPDSRECIFFQAPDPGCGIYEDRPRECRILECWNPEGFQVLKQEKRLSRLDLLDPADPLLSVMKTHEERCDLLRMQEWLIRAVEGAGGEDEKVVETLQYDRHVRAFLGEQFNLERRHLDFLLGRPLEEVVVGLGFSVQVEPGGRVVVRRDGAADSGRGTNGR
jgi:Fe-S-cluster containining protein